jgi:hypothetical protein
MYVLFEIFILIATGIQFAMRDYIFSMKPFYINGRLLIIIHVMWLYSCNRGTFCSNGWLLSFQDILFLKAYIVYTSFLTVQRVVL